MPVDAWPAEVPHGFVEFEEVGGAASGGAFGGLTPATVASAGGPHWRATVTRARLRTAAAINAARALEGRLDGGAAPVLVPTCDRHLAPQAPGGAAMVAEFAGARSANEREVVINLSGGYLPLVGGEPFSVEHGGDIGRRLYRIDEVIGGTEAGPELLITPALRADVDTETVIDFLTPSCPMRLAGGFDLAVELGRFADLEAEFIEWFAASPANPITSLAALGLTPAEILEESVEDTLVGRIISDTPGSTVTLVDDAGDRFKLVEDGAVWKIYTGSTATDYEAATSHNITVRETLLGRPNSPRDTVIAIAVIAAAVVVPTFVQEKGVGGVLAATLNSAPTDGNYLIACGYDNDNALVVNAAAGWVSLGSMAPTGDAPGMRIAYKGPLAGATAAQTPFLGTPGSNRGGVFVVEVSNIADMAAAVEAVAFSPAPAVGSGTAVVSADTTRAETLALAFGGWENFAGVTFTIAITSGWSGSYVSGPNSDNRAGVMGRKSVSGSGVTVTATTTTGVPYYGLTGGLILLGSPA